MDFNAMNSGGGQQRAGEGGNLDFEEDLHDIPSGLVFGEQQQPAPGHVAQQQYLAQQPRPPSQPHPLMPPYPTHYQFNQFTGFAPPPHLAQHQQQQQQGLPPLVAQQQHHDLQPAPKRPRGRPRKVAGTESRGGAAASPRGKSRGTRARGRAVRGGKGRGRGKRGRGSSEDEEDPSDQSDSDSDKAGGGDDDDDEDQDGEGMVSTTKYGRKISKPKTFVPTNRPTIQRKKRPVHNPDAHLMCQVCRTGHSQPVNKLVICDSCAKGWHQLCHEPNIQEEVVASDLSWLCKSCDTKLAESRPAVDVTAGVWTNSSAYTLAEKREWLEGLPLHSLIGYILSIEKKYAPHFQTSALAIWPPSLPTVLVEARSRRAAEEEQGRLKEEAANATESESGTPAPPEPLARTAASVRAAAAQVQEPPKPSVLQQPPPPPPGQQQQQQQHRPTLPPMAVNSRAPPPYLRQNNFAPVPALQAQQQQQQHHQYQQQHQQQQQQHQQHHQQQQRSPHLNSSPWGAPYPTSSSSSQPYQPQQPPSAHAYPPYAHPHRYPSFINNPSPPFLSHSPGPNHSPNPNQGQSQSQGGGGADGETYRLFQSLNGGREGWSGGGGRGGGDEGRGQEGGQSNGGGGGQ